MTTLFILYSIALLIALVGNIFIIKYTYPTQTSIDNSVEQEFSIVIAAKNEEENLPPLFKSIKSIDYPTDKYEVIFVDDNSTDKSNTLISEFAVKNKNIKLIKAIDKKLPAKKGALTIGINTSKFGNILITDADCIIPTKWLKIYSKYFNSKSEIFFGKAPFYQTESFANKLACFENLRSYLLTFSFANAGIPFSAAARNFGFKKSAWQKLKGYENTAETFSGDDDLLIREAVKNNLKISAITDNEAMVYSSTTLYITDYIKQKSRHLSTSHFYLFKHQILLGLWHSANIFSIASILLTPISYLFLIPFCIKILIDIITVLLTKKQLNYSFNVGEIILLQSFYEIVLIIGFILSIFNKRKW